MRRRALLAGLALPIAARAEDGPPVFIELRGTDSDGPVAVAVRQAVRVARLENQTIIDTTTFVQLQTREAVDSVANRLIAAGLPMVALTDLTGARTYVAVHRVVSVRPAHERHASGARASLIVDGLRFSRDLAVREDAATVLTAIRRAGRAPE